MRSRLLCASRIEEWRVGRVVFGENAERDKWSRLESLLQDIAAHQPSDPSIVPDGPAIGPQDSVSDSSVVVALSPQPDIFQSLPSQPLHPMRPLWPHVSQKLSSLLVCPIPKLPM